MTQQSKTDAYTYEDVKRRAAELGYTLSQADDRLAQNNPAAGLSILQYQSDYNRATDVAARSLAHQMAQQIRQQYGGYLAGADGTGYSLDVLGPQDYAWDPQQSSAYAQYRAAALREGRRAVSDAISEASKRTGGLPSSDAVQAGAQTGQAYAAKIADAVQTFRKQDRQEYLDALSWYQNLAQQQQQAELQQQYRRAQLALQMGDTETLQRMGFDTTQMQAQTAQTEQQAKQNAQYNRARLALQMGDYATLRALGYFPS